MIFVFNDFFNGLFLSFSKKFINKQLPLAFMEPLQVSEIALKIGVPVLMGIAAIVYVVDSILSKRR
jgi:hypothetical protein